MDVSFSHAHLLQAQTPLHSAAMHGYLSICTLLLDRGIELEARDRRVRLHWMAFE